MGKHSNNNDGAAGGNMVARILVGVVAALAIVAGVVVSVGANPLAHEAASSSASSASSAAASSEAVSSQRSSSLTKSAANGMREGGHRIPEADEQHTATNDTDAKVLEALEAPVSATQRKDIIHKAQQTALEYDATPQLMKYCVAGRGNVGSLGGFENTLFRVLNNPKGWPRAGVYFEQAKAPECDFTIYLSASADMTSFSPACSKTYSCRVGDDVIVNKDRWDHGIAAWLAAGGTLSQYRTMVINHEVGHRLGHMDNETTCAGNGKSAPLMQEQSMHLDGCTPNAWPLDNELWTDLSY